MVHRGHALVDSSSITIMIHTTLRVSFDEILLVHMTFKMCSHIGHNMCLDE
jgi:hypothetical protein